MAFFSFNSAKSLSNFKGFSMRWYESLFGNSQLLDAVIVSVTIAILATVISLSLIHIWLGELLFLGVGEEKSGGRERESVLANIFESFIGALYLDCGKDEVIKILEQTIFQHVNDLDYDDITDYKTTLQELIQADQRKTVTYELLETSGPSNAPEFKVAVIMDEMRLGIGKGTSKKRAEQQAAKDALLSLIHIFL